MTDVPAESLLPTPIRWIRRFVRTDANQPVRTMRLILTVLRRNQWLLLEESATAVRTFFAMQKFEITSTISKAEPESNTSEILKLSELPACELMAAPSAKQLPKIFADPIEKDIPWPSRKVVLDANGEPVAIGVPRKQRQLRRKEAYFARDLARELSKEEVVSYQAAPRPSEPVLLGQPGPPQDVPQDYKIVRVFYATDRACGVEQGAYTGKRNDNGSLQFGACDVSIPRDHRISNLESPRWWRFEFKWKPASHVMLLETLPLSEENFLSNIKDHVQESDAKDAFVFVHGFNVTFEDGVRRTAQLTYDLGFKGAPILYSWPSAGHIKGYLADEATIDWTRPHLELFLTKLSIQSGASVIHLIAHSMGNRAVVRMLERLYLLQTMQPRFQQVVLTAPDIDAGEFLQLATNLGNQAKRVTLYASSKDEAIQLSKRVHAYARAGEAGDDIVVVAGVDTIDASSVDTSLLGHSYYGDRRTVISDIYYLLTDGKPPNQRHGLEARMCARGGYWAFRP